MYRNLKTLTLAISVALVAARGARAQQMEWPKTITLPEGQLVIYQPQAESFKDDKLTARAALMATRNETPEPIFGVLWLSARTVVDRDARIVRLTNITLDRMHFPDADPAKVENVRASIQSQVPQQELEISLDRLIAMLQLAETEATAGADFKEDPPEIIVMHEPAVLVSIDGAPKYMQVPDSELTRIVNTPFFIVFDPRSKAHYLKAGAAWMSAADFLGPWQPAAQVPAAVQKLGAGDGAPFGEAGPMPKIVVATKPTELLYSMGEPEFLLVPGTSLMYVTNTESDVFVDMTDNRIFALLSGRWYTAATKEGPWAYIPPGNLPAMFSKIPPDSPKGHVLASVAGTMEATEAIMDTYVPQTATIRREGAQLDVAYDGLPKFERIQGSSVEYAVNTEFDVVKAESEFYCCHDGVWYQAPAATGPWEICVEVPDVIYSIPPSNPLHRVTYVKVYDSTPEEVYVGYTPGYTGSYADDGVVVYGTGYAYRGWSGASYYARPATYGYAPRYNAVNGVWGARAGYGAGWIAASPSYGVGGGSGGWWGVGGYRDAAWESTTETRWGDVRREGEISRSPGQIEGERSVSGPWGREMTDEASITRSAGQIQGERTVRGPQGREVTRQGEIQRTNNGAQSEVVTRGPRGNQVERETEVQRTAGGAQVEQSIEGSRGNYASKETDVQRQSDGFEVTREVQGPGGGSAAVTTDVSYQNGEVVVDRSGWADPAANPTNVYQRNPNATSPDAAPKDPSAAVRPGAAERAVMPAGAPKDLYADASGNVYKRSMDGWETRQGNQWTKPGAQGAVATGQVATATGQAATATGQRATATGQAATGRPAAQSAAQRPSSQASASNLNKQYEARARGQQRTQASQQSRSTAARASTPRPSTSTRSAPARSGGGGARRGR